MNEKVLEYFNNRSDEERLFMDYNHSIEYITNMTFINGLIRKESKVLDIFSGSGSYSFKLAKLGHTVTAGGITENEINLLSDKQALTPILNEIIEVDPLDLSKYNNCIFDFVIFIGPMYYLENSDRNVALMEALRVLKPNGYLILSYINRNAVALKTVSESMDNIEDVMDILQSRVYKDIYKVYTPREIEFFLNGFKVNIIHHYGSDGIGYRIPKVVNKAKKENFNKWLKYHIATCEDKDILGYSLHSSVILKKI